MTWPKINLSLDPMTVPNLLSLLRILAIPFFAIAVWYGRMWEACAIFAGAGLTDMLDGFIARRFNQKSDLGALLDPAADKLLMTTAFVLLTWRIDHMVAPIPAWVAILAITRDVLISFVALFGMGSGDKRRLPSMLGKITTATQLIAISLGLLINAMGPRSWTHFVTPAVYYLVALLVLASGLQYFFRSMHSDLDARDRV